MNADNMESLRTRFDRFNQPEPNSGCFLWLGCIDASGYGRIAFQKRNWKANRIAWLIAYEDPADMHVLHRCDNRLCVNVDHLFLGTNTDNSRDRTVKGRSWPGANVDHVRAVRAARDATGYGHRRIAKALGISPHVTYGILYRGTYRHVS